jgi:hypothetical protein
VSANIGLFGYGLQFNPSRANYDLSRSLIPLMAAGSVWLGGEGAFCSMLEGKALGEQKRRWTACICLRW